MDTWAIFTEELYVQILDLGGGRKKYNLGVFPLTQI
jgi:hypothetical protein